MIRIMRKLHAMNTIRYTQRTSIRLFSSKSDDSSIPIFEPLEEKSETSAEENFAPASETKFHSNSLYSGNNASVIALLENLPAESDGVSLQGILEFYDRIRGKYLFTYDTIKHPKFKVLREATLAYLPQLNTKEVKDVFIALLPSKSIMHNKLGAKIAEALIKRASFLPFDQIVFVDFMLRKCYKVGDLSKDYNIVRLSLQPLFLAKVEDDLDGSNSFEDTMKILAYCENNSEIIPTKIVNSITTSLLLADEEKFAVTDVTSVLIFLSNFGESNEHTQKLFRKMIDLWYQLPVTARDVIVLFKILGAKGVDKNIFEQTNFTSHAVNIITREDDKKYSFSLQNSFNKMGLVDTALIDHLSKYFETAEQVRELVVNDYIILCTACANANFKPSNWESHILVALKTFKFSIYITGLGSFDWAQFVLHLYKLGHIDVRLIKNILNSKYLQKQRWYEQAKLAKLQDILEREDVSSNDSDSEGSSLSSTDTDDELPLYDDLKEMFGASKLWPNVRVNRKVTIPYALKMDLQTGDFLPFPREPSLRNIGNNELLIGIVIIPEESVNQWTDRRMLDYAKNQCHRLERRRIASVIIEENKWKTLKAYEKSLVFYTKVVTTMEIYRKKQLNKLGK